MFEEVTLGPKRTIMTIATIIAPYTEFTFKNINENRLAKERIRPVKLPLLIAGHGAFFALSRISAKCSGSSM
jgi:hypothetical protein